MSEKKYLLTHDEICQLQDIALSALAWENDDNDEMVELKQTEYRALLESHEYRERTCHNIYPFDADIFECSECEYEDYGNADPAYCAGCGAKVVCE